VGLLFKIHYFIFYIFYSVAEFFPQGESRRGLNVDHSLPPSAEVKNEWSHNSIPPGRLHGIDRENFTTTISHSLLCLLTL
jgi:hypothetical protein